MKLDNIRIGDICELKYGKALKSENRSGGDYPVYGSGGIVGYHDEYLVEKPTLIIGRKGSVGEIYFSDKSCWPIDTAYYLEYDLKRIDLQWFRNQLLTLNLKSLNKSAAVPGLNRNDVYSIRIFVPPLKDQIHIANILSKVEALIKNRKESLFLLDEFLKNTFLEMFIDEKKFEEWGGLITIKGLVEQNKHSIKAGPFGSSLKKNFYVEKGYKIYGQEQVIADDLSIGDYYINEEHYKKLESCKIKEGDILISLVGTYGKVSIVPKKFEPGIINPRLMKISFDKNKIHPLYFKFLLQSVFILKQTKRLSRGGTMDILNVGIVKELSIPKPPLKLQTQFANIVERTEVLKAQYQASLHELENLYGSLSQKAFKGELNLKGEELVMAAEPRSRYGKK